MSRQLVVVVETVELVSRLSSDELARRVELSIDDHAVACRSFSNGQADSLTRSLHLGPDAWPRNEPSPARTLMITFRLTRWPMHILGCIVCSSETTFEIFVRLGRAPWTGIDTQRCRQTEEASKTFRLQCLGTQHKQFAPIPTPLLVVVIVLPRSLSPSRPTLSLACVSLMPHNIGRPAGSTAKQTTDTNTDNDLLMILRHKQFICGGEFLLRSLSVAFEHETLGILCQIIIVVLTTTTTSVETSTTLASTTMWVGATELLTENVTTGKLQLLAYTTSGDDEDDSRNGVELSDTTCCALFVQTWICRTLEQRASVGKTERGNEARCSV